MSLKLIIVFLILLIDYNGFIHIVALIGIGLNPNVVQAILFGFSVITFQNCFFSFLLTLWSWFYYFKAPLKLTKQRNTPLFSFLIPILLIAPSFFIDFYQAQQGLMLLAFMLASYFQTVMNESKALLNNYRHRFYICVIRKEKFTLQFLNQRQKDTLIHIIIVFLFSSLFVVIRYFSFKSFIKGFWILSYLFLVEFDMLIQGRYLNKSKLYYSELMLFLNNQLHLSFIAFYLLFISLNELLIDYIPGILNLLQTLFDLWIGGWIVFFMMRLLNTFKIKKKYLLSFSLLLLTSCTKSHIETMTLINQSPMFYGIIEHVEIQEVQPSQNHFFTNFKSGDTLKAEDIIFTEYFEEHEKEIKKIDFLIEVHKKEIEDDASELKKLSGDHPQVSILKQNIKTNENTIKELKFDKSQLQTSKDTLAIFDGTVFIEDKIFKVFSNQLVLKLYLNESEYRLFKDFESFDVFSLDKEHIANSRVSQVTPILQSSYEEGPSYEVWFEAFEHNCYPYQSILIQPDLQLFFIPSRFINKKDNALFVNKNQEEIKIIGEVFSDDYFIIKEGLKEGDVLISYE